MNLLVCEFATKDKTEKGLLRARLLKQFISCRDRWRAESWQRRSIGLGGIVSPGEKRSGSDCTRGGPGRKGGNINLVC